MDEGHPVGQPEGGVTEPVRSVGVQFAVGVVEALDSCAEADFSAALTDGYHLAWVISAGIAVVALGIGVTVLKTVRLGEVSVPSIAEEIIEDEPTTYAEAA